MGLLQLLSLWGRTERLSEIAQHIAERSQREVVQQTAGRMNSMSNAERRGYIRARAAAAIHRETDVALRVYGQLRASDRAVLVELATQAVIATVFAANVPIRHSRAA